MDIVPSLWKHQLLDKSKSQDLWLIAQQEWKLKQELAFSGPKHCSWLGAVLLPARTLQAWARAGALLELLQVSETLQSDSMACGTTEELLLFAVLLGWCKFQRKSYNLLHVLQEEFHSRSLKILCIRHHGIYHMRGSENGLKWYSSKNLHFLVLLFLE